jgi:4-hydroxybenzoate polyprenyltransferase
VVWLKLGRVSNLPTVWSNTLAGCLLAGTLPSWWWLAAACASFSLYYIGGMYLNDAFDRNIDARERPERPIPSGKVSAGTVFGAGSLMLALGVATSIWLALGSENPAPLGSAGAGLLLAGLIVFYDAYHKTNPLSPLVMGLCRVMVYVTASVMATGTVTRAVVLSALALLCHLVGLTYAAKQESLSKLSSLWPFALLVVPFGFGMSLGLITPASFVFAFLYLAYMAFALSFLRQGPRRFVPAAVVRMIAAISLVDAIVLSSAASLEFALAAVACLPLTRLAQRYVPGT